MQSARVMRQNQALFDYDGNVLPALDVIKNFKK